MPDPAATEVSARAWAAWLLVREHPGTREWHARDLWHATHAWRPPFPSARAAHGALRELAQAGHVHRVHHGDLTYYRRDPVPSTPG
jgi:hypothetical protein